jgi:hypothetical protein
MKSKFITSFLMVSIIASTTLFLLSLKERTEAVDIRYPNFVPEVTLEPSRVNLIIKKNLIQAGLNEILKENERRLEDTNFNRITLKNTEAKVVGDVLELGGTVQVEHREKIACFRGKCKYTPWVSASGRLSQKFGVAVRNNKTQVRNIDFPKIQGLEGRWYSPIVSSTGNYFKIDMHNKISSALSAVNGLDIRKYAIISSYEPIAQKLGVNKDQVLTILNQGVPHVNAGFLQNGDFIISFARPQGI